jgi:hypothetical protein
MRRLERLEQTVEAIGTELGTLRRRVQGLEVNEVKGRHGQIQTWLTMEEKNQLSATMEPFNVESVIVTAHPTYGPRYEVSIELDGTRRLVGFSKGHVPARDRVLERIKRELFVFPRTRVRAFLVQHGEVRRHFHVVEE